MVYMCVCEELSFGLRVIIKFVAYFHRKTPSIFLGRFAPVQYDHDIEVDILLSGIRLDEPAFMVSVCLAHCVTTK